MQVETYEVISNDPSKGDNALVAELESEEAQRLIDQLGLDGQRQLLAPDDSGVVTRNPYRRMTETEARVYRCLLPQQVEVSAYGDGPIPLRVLQVAAHARELFPRLEVWFEAGSRDDPLLVGCDSSGQYTTRERHLLARWGEVLRPFEELLELVKPKLRAQWVKQLTDGIQERERFLASIDVQIDAHFSGSFVHVPG